MSIAKLLEAQKVDKQKLQCRLALKKSAVAIELENSQKVQKELMERARWLNDEAKKLQEKFQTFSNLLQTTLDNVEKAKKNKSEDLTEYNGYVTQLTMMESQLTALETAIKEKTDSFNQTYDRLKETMLKIKKYTPVYQAKEADTNAKITALEKEFAEKSQDIDSGLLHKYLEIRRSYGDSDPKDVVVPLNGNWCSGCNYLLPGVIVNKINTSGWALCEKCGRIIYKNENA